MLARREPLRETDRTRSHLHSSRQRLAAQVAPGSVTEPILHPIVWCRATSYLLIAGPPCSVSGEYYDRLGADPACTQTRDDGLDNRALSTPDVSEGGKVTPDRRPPGHSLVQRILHYQSIPYACEPATRVNDRQKVLATTKDSWRSMTTIAPAAGSFLLLLPVAELTTTIPTVGAVFVLTAMVENWFIPHAEAREIPLEDVRQGFWFVKRQGSTITVAQVIVAIRNDTGIKLALRDGNAYSGVLEEKVWIAELRDPYKRWRRRRPLTTTHSVPRDLNVVKKIVTAVVALRQHGDVCTCATDRTVLAKWAEQEGLADLGALLGGAIIFGLLQEQDGKIQPTDAGRVLLEAPGTRDRVPEPPAAPPHNVWIANPASSVIILGAPTQSQFSTGPNSGQELNVGLNDERKVLDLLNAIADNQHLLWQKLSALDVGEIGGMTAVLSEAISNGELHTAKAKQALRTLRDICRELIPGVISSAVWEGLKDLLS